MFENFFIVISAIISIVALIFRIISFFQSRSSVVCDFFQQGDSKDMKRYRKVIYDIYNKESDKDVIIAKLRDHETEVTHVISFFDFWSLMVKKHYLPKWTFQASSKFVAVRIFDMVKPYIFYRRADQSEYASHYEWLINKIR